MLVGQAAREGRIAGVLRAVAEERPVTPGVRLGVRPRALRFRLRWPLAAAAVLVLGTLLVVMGVPGERTALAEVQGAVGGPAAARGTGGTRKMRPAERFGGGCWWEAGRGGGYAVAWFDAGAALAAAERGGFCGA